jgi:hypothetical protein
MGPSVGDQEDLDVLRAFAKEEALGGANGGFQASGKEDAWTGGDGSLSHGAIDAQNPGIVRAFPDCRART